MYTFVSRWSSAKIGWAEFNRSNIRCKWTLLLASSSEITKKGSSSGSDFGSWSSGSAVFRAGRDCSRNPQTFTEKAKHNSQGYSYFYNGAKSRTHANAPMMKNELQEWKTDQHERSLFSTPYIFTTTTMRLCVVELGRLILFREMYDEYTHTSFGWLIPFSFHHCNRSIWAYRLQTNKQTPIYLHETSLGMIPTILKQ